MLNKITVHGFKSLERQTIKLGALNVIIGANGSGKSNLFSALSFFKATTLGQLDTFVKRSGGADRLLFHGKKSTQSCFFSCEEESFSYEQTLIPVAGDQLAVVKESLSFFGSEVEYTGGGTDIDSLEQYVRDEESRQLELQVTQGELSKEKSSESLSEFPSAKKQIENWRMYHLQDTTPTAALKSTCNIDDNRYLREDASNLVAYLYWLKLKQPKEYRRIISVIQLALPYFEDFILEPLRRNEQTIRLEWKQRNSDAYFDADSLSDGSLRFISLATVLNQPKWTLPRLILIDEPESGLHPLAIHLLAEMLDAASQQTQIMVATQSVTLLDNFPLEQIIVADHDGRSSLFRRLKADDYKMWLEHFSVGELWEKNVLGGRP